MSCQWLHPILSHFMIFSWWCWCTLVTNWSHVRVSLLTPRKGHQFQATPETLSKEIVKLEEWRKGGGEPESVISKQKTGCRKLFQATTRNYWPSSDGITALSTVLSPPITSALIRTHICLGVGPLEHSRSRSCSPFFMGYRKVFQATTRNYSPSSALQFFLSSHYFCTHTRTQTFA